MHTFAYTKCVIALGTVMVLSGCNDAGDTDQNWRQGRQDTVTKVIVQPVSFKADTSRVQAVGTARAKASAEIFPEVNGEVVAVNFTAGTPVEAGQILIRLEARAEELAVRRSEVAVRDAEQLLDRYDRIDVPGAISESQIDTARTALEAAKIDLDLARNSLADRTVRAPFSGYTGLSNIDPGARVTPQTQVTRLDDRSELFIDFAAPEQVFGGIRAGDFLKMEPFSAPGQMIDAEVQAIDSGIDPTTRAFTIRSKVDNLDDTLRPGMSFRVNFDLPGVVYPSVPETSILWGGDGAYVWTVLDSVASQTAVDVVARHQGQVLVRGDLDETSQIIVEGVQKVRPGSRVQTVAPSNEPNVAEQGQNGPASASTNVVAQ
ncbi:MAG: efflux RND transporter periplasmic adaptor subunit [Pseudomonadota bacterium]